MIISIDYDETYTKDKECFLEIVRTFKKAGHTVYCVTMRRPHEISTMCKRLLGLVEVKFTDGKAKKPFMQAQGINVDVWIDDSPHWVVQDAY